MDLIANLSLGFATALSLPLAAFALLGSSRLLVVGGDSATAAILASGLLAAGIVGKSRAARAAALGLLVVTVLKAFLHDLGRLGGLYRVASFVGLAVSLALVAIAIQKFVLAPREKD